MIGKPGLIAQASARAAAGVKGTYGSRSTFVSSHAPAVRKERVPDQCPLRSHTLAQRAGWTGGGDQHRLVDLDARHGVAVSTHSEAITTDRFLSTSSSPATTRVDPPPQAGQRNRNFST